MHPRARSLRIAISNPYTWPYVRRGSERLLHDLSHYLSALGHEVSVLTMAPEERQWESDGIRYRCLKGRFGSRFRQFNDCHFFAIAAVDAFRDTHADVVHCLNYFDAYAALTARRRFRKSFKVVFHAVGIPTRAYFRSVPLDAWFMRKTLRESDAVAALSNFACARLKQDFGRDAILLPPPVAFNMEFEPPLTVARTPSAPMLLFVGDILEARKGARLACEALLRVRESYPQARLYLSGRTSAAWQRDLFADPRFASLHSDIVFTGLGSIEELEDLYAEASIVVLPSVWEAFGLVLIEALARGTPVVGSDHAGIPDIIPPDTPDIGQLFDAGEFGEASTNVHGLAAAIVRVLDHLQTHDVTASCRAHARQFSWDVLGPRYVELYNRTLQEGPE